MSPISVYAWHLRVILITRPRDNDGYAGLLDKKEDETSPEMEISIFGLVIRGSAALHQAYQSCTLIPFC